MLNFNNLISNLEGELFTDNLHKSIYATDASVYRMLPKAVCYPKHNNDLKQLVAFATKHNIALIPRAAGTSLAGQCVGEGIIVDVSKYFTNILNLDTVNQTVTVQPGVVRDSLNAYLKPFGLCFGPNTSTSNRCMIGGMVGNNSSGTTSIQYGVTRDKVVALKTVLSDGEEVTFSALTNDEFEAKRKLPTLEGEIYNTLYNTLADDTVKAEIINQFPKPEIHRRNTGYAIDELITTKVFDDSTTRNFNMCKLLSGSEGTLALTTEITLQLDVLPPQESVIVALHFSSIAKCLNTVAATMQHKLYACEMMDKTILDLTKHNATQQSNRQFIMDDPEAILLCELRADTTTDLQSQIDHFISSIKATELSYAQVVLEGEDSTKAFELRKAGLGLLGNIIGDKKAVACIEDTAVALSDLSDYISDFTALMKRYQQDAVYYAHAGAGELHLRPILNLKRSEDITYFKQITMDVAHLVKRYKGSMSGEHGDGIVRSSCIEIMIGEANYKLLKIIKTAFDPNNIFNPNKIVNPYAMTDNLRYEADKPTPDIATIQDFSSSEGILREAEKCNGSGDCRKSAEFGGTMCPSYRATTNEKDTTRARANMLREVLTQSEAANKFDSKDLKTVFDLCLSCKACKTECPSSVDVAALKAEFQYQYNTIHGTSLRTKAFAYNDKLNALGSRFPKLTNAVFSNTITASILKSVLGIAKERTLPKISTNSLDKEIQNTINQNIKINSKRTIYLFIDEFSNHLDADIGRDAYQLLTALEYNVKTVNNVSSGRSLISKGFLKQAKTLANKNIEIYKDIISEDCPLIGIEPSAILSFRDDYLRLADDKAAAKHISKHTFLIDEFLAKEIEAGNITTDAFSTESKTIKLHAHCYQKALGNPADTFTILNLPKNYTVTMIPSGCCGMAGSFGYEKEHYTVSMTIGEQTLFPKIRRADANTLIAANGTSCRHQIKDGTQRTALHPVTILREALL